MRTLSKPLLLLLALWICIPAASAATPVIDFLTRAEGARLLLTASREDVPGIRSDRFYPDVLEGQSFTKYIMYAVELGMIDAEPTRGLIFPHRSISRAEFLKMLTIAFDLERGLRHTFFDVDKDTWYEEFAGVATLYQLFEDSNLTGRLHPSFRITQLEAYRALEVFFEKAPHLKPSTFTIQTTKRAKLSGETTATPSRVKEAMLRLFRLRGGIKPDVTKREIIDAVNRERAMLGLVPLIENSYLTYAAQKHAQDMHHRGFFGHVTPEGLDYVDRIRDSHYLDVDQDLCQCRSVFNMRAVIEKGRTETSPHHISAQTELCGCEPRFALGENIAKGQLTADQVMNDWMTSESHKRTIMHPEFEEIGVGLFGKVWVQTFGRLTLEL